MAFRGFVAAHNPTESQRRVDPPFLFCFPFPPLLWAQRSTHTLVQQRAAQHAAQLQWPQPTVGLACSPLRSVRCVFFFSSPVSAFERGAIFAPRTGAAVAADLIFGERYEFSTAFRLPLDNGCHFSRSSLGRKKLHIHFRRVLHRFSRIIMPIFLYAFSMEHFFLSIQRFKSNIFRQAERHLRWLMRSINAPGWFPNSSIAFQPRAVGDA